MRWLLEIQDVGRALVPDPLHAYGARGDGGPRPLRRRRRALPDHRIEPRRRHLRRRAIPVDGRPLRHRLGFEHPHRARRGAPHARILAAPARPGARRPRRARPARPGARSSRAPPPAARRRSAATPAPSARAPGPISSPSTARRWPSPASTATRRSTAGSSPATTVWCATSGAPAATSCATAGTSAATASRSATAAASPGCATRSEPAASCGHGHSRGGASSLSHASAASAWSRPKDLDFQPGDQRALDLCGGPQPGRYRSARRSDRTARSGRKAWAAGRTRPPTRRMSAWRNR